MTSDTKETKFVECSCSHCQDMCKHHPCTATIDDIRTLVKNGHLERLAVDNFEIEEPDPFLPGHMRWKTVRAILPAVFGNEGGFNPYHGQCTFFKDGLCEIHGLKPLCGKLANCSLEWWEREEFLKKHNAVVLSWDTNEGREMVEWFLRAIIAITDLNLYEGNEPDKMPG